MFAFDNVIIDVDIFITKLLQKKGGEKEMKVRCRKLRVIPKRVLQKYLRPERCHNFLAADMVHDVVEVPVEEAVPIRVNVGNFIPEAGFWEEEMQGYFWKDTLWVDVKEWEEICPILAYSDGTVEDTAERR